MTALDSAPVSDQSPASEAGADTATALELPAAACEGYIDFIAPRRAFGWAWCREFPKAPVDVEIRIDDRPVTTARAEKFRPDLAGIGIGNGHHAFDVGLPDLIPPKDRHRVSAYVLVAPGRPEVPLINRTVAAPTAVAAGPGAALPQGPDANRPPVCASQVRDVLSRVMAGQKTIEGSLTGLGNEIQRLASSGVGVDSRAEMALATAIDQLHAMQETLGQQTAAAEILQARLDGLVAMFSDRETAPVRQPGGDRALYWSVGVLALLSLTALGFGIYSLIG